MVHNFEAWYPELPTLLFGEINGVIMFNATYYMSKRNVEGKSVDEFKERYKETIEYLSKELNVSPENVIITDEDSNIMIHEALALPFVAYLNPYFMLYFSNKLHDLFADGIAWSDVYLATMAKKQLPKRLITELAS